MKMLLIDNDLWDCVARPNEYREERADLDRRDARARSKICLSVSEVIYPVIMAATTEADTWSCLKKTYADSGLIRRLSLLKKLFNSKASTFHSMEEFINSIRDTQQ